MDITLAQLAVQLDGDLIGGNADHPVLGVAGYDNVAEGGVTYITDERRLAAAEASPALAIIASFNIKSATKPLILVADPRAAFARALTLFDWRRTPWPGIDTTAVIAKSSAIHARAHISSFVTVAERAVIGDGCVIYPYVYIGDQVEIGANTIIYPHVTIYPHCSIGKCVIIHAGTVIGSDGLGFQPDEQKWKKIPHLGEVVIEDDVEIGANVTIDRATTGTTIIGAGTKIDNLVHIAHNVKIGPNCMIIAQVGIAGSSTLGENVIIAGQAGVNDHCHIGAHARIAVRGGVTRDVPAGVTVSGFPAQPHADELRMEAATHRLPDLLVKVRELEKRLKDLEKDV